MSKFSMGAMENSVLLECHAALSGRKAWTRSVAQVQTNVSTTTSRRQRHWPSHRPEDRVLDRAARANCSKSGRRRSGPLVGLDNSSTRSGQTCASCESRPTSSPLCSSSCLRGGSPYNELRRASFDRGVRVLPGVLVGEEWILAAELEDILIGALAVADCVEANMFA
eukprot:CAMPEP_0194523154 /NCGR_PEP_ID=MMETSP0253-20130528/57978_1 /TAXON_ID=2966 /ORGANISM="Noctiluca scintillans" /LENGTH=166 /DNA_ID=CAMNT_0039367659 /DNA_START=184 /DNA_END=686 /DNA_ORIENTATION=+